MTLPPGWKVRREVYRVYDKVVRGVTAAVYDPPRQFLYDRSFARRVAFTDGGHAFGPKIAIFVLYQPRLVPASVFFTLRHLSDHGWSPLVVSNAPLSDADRKALAGKAALVVERPNVGYDFGAYRDGLRIVTERGLRPERLIVMNDSTWFPLRNADTTLARMETAGVDMVGHIFKIEDDDKREHDHVESHLLMFSATALNHAAFAQFWRRYTMSNYRERTVQCGEKGLTAAMRRSSLAYAGLLTRERIIEQLAALESPQLAEAVGQLVLHLARPRATAAALLAQQPHDAAWRQSVLDMCRGLLNGRKHLVSTTFIEPAQRLGGMGFVKKAQDRRHHLARVRVLDAVAAGRLPPMQDDVAREMRQMVDGWVEPYDWRLEPGTGTENW